MKVESAQLEGKHIGWRISAGNDVVLVWEDQQAMPGIRLGDEFIAGVGKEIVYSTCNLNETTSGVKNNEH